MTLSNGVKHRLRRRAYVGYTSSHMWLGPGRERSPDRRTLLEQFPEELRSPTAGRCLQESSSGTVLSAPADSGGLGLSIGTGQVTSRTTSAVLRAGCRLEPGLDGRTDQQSTRNSRRRIDVTCHLSEVLGSCLKFEGIRHVMPFTVSKALQNVTHRFRTSEDTHEVW